MIMLTLPFAEIPPITTIPPAITAALFFFIGLWTGTFLAHWIVYYTPGAGDDGEQEQKRKQERKQEQEQEQEQETGDRRQETGDRRQETGDRRQEAGVGSDGASANPESRILNPGSWIRFLPIVGFVVSRRRGAPADPWIPVIEIGTGVLFAVFAIAVTYFQCQHTSKVIPDEIWRYGRLAYHLVLISLLIAASGTDLRDYIIPDGITVTGILIGVLGAAVSGQTQIMHLWVDWNQDNPISGAYIPAWIDGHRVLHGFAWSLTGLLVGGGITWLVRAVSSWLLGRPAMGFGDVTLMAMIGSFLGWQAVCFVFLLAPWCGIVVGLSVRVFTGRSFVPFGPYLAVAAVLVLMSWRWLWLPTRDIFGHGLSIAALAGAAFAALVLLLGLMRLYQAIPVKHGTSADNPRDEETTL